jgi:hypothetical protein
MNAAAPFLVLYALVLAGFLPIWTSFTNTRAWRNLAPRADLSPKRFTLEDAQRIWAEMESGA